MSLIKNVAWMLAGRWAYNLITLVSFTSIVALISPSDFGVFTLASTFIILSDVFYSDAVENLIVRQEGDDDGIVSTIFWVVIGFAVMIALVVVAIAVPFGTAYDSRPLVWATAFIGALILVQGAASVPRAMLMRHGRSRSYAMASASSNLAGAAVGITAAYLGMGFWSLIMQQACLQLVMLVVCSVSSGFRPVARLDRPLARDFAARLAVMLWSTVLNVLGNRLDILVIGTVFGNHVVGVYGLAKRLIQIVQDLVASSFDKVLLSTVSRSALKEQSETVYRNSVILQGMTAIPSFAGFALLSPLLIPLVFGREWSDAAPLIGLMAVGGIFRSIVTIERAQQLAAGQFRVLANVRLAELAIGLATTLPLAVLGPEVAAIVFSARYVVGYLLVVVSRVGIARAIPVLAQNAAWLSAPVLATVAMSIVVYGVLGVAASLWRPELQAAVGVVAGVGTFVLFLLFTKRFWLAPLRAAA